MKAKTITLLTGLILSYSSFAQKPVFIFQHQALAVSDVNRSSDFYMKYFGLQEIVNRAQSDNIRWFSMGPGIELHLIQVDNKEIHLAKQIHLAFSTESFQGFLNLLDENKIEYTDWPGTKKGAHLRADGIFQIYFQDPDGHWIEVNDEYKP